MYELCSLIKNESTESTNEAESINNIVNTLPNLNTDIVYINYEEKIEEPTDSDEFHADDNHNSDDKPTDVDFSIQDNVDLDAASQLQGNIHENHLSKFDECKVIDRSFKCHMCTASFTQASNLKRHIKSRHVGEKKFKCDLCLKSYTTKVSLNYHLKSHTGQKPFKCTMCNYACKINSILNKHYRRKHSISNHVTSEFYCLICGKNFLAQYDFKQHMLVHEKPFKCTTCGVNFSLKANLKRHMLTHTGEKPFDCHICHKRFTVKESLKKHLKSHKTEPFKCTACEYVCVTQYQLKIHKWRQHNTFEGEQSNCCCFICDKKFPHEDYLRSHMLDHEKIKCHICGVIFSEKLELEAHMTIHTCEKSFECHMCNKHYPLNYKLQHYLESHMEKKPFQCHLCNKRFVYKNSLRDHLKNHMTKQPFECTQTKDTGITQEQDENQSKAKSKLFECRTCRQTFINQHDLKCHMLNYGHPLKCSVCETIFVVEAKLKQHMKTHIRENRLDKLDFDSTRWETLRMQPNHNDDLEENSSSCEFIKGNDVSDFDNESNSSRLSVTILDNIDVTSQLQDENSKFFLSEYKMKLAEPEDNSFKCTICDTVFILKKNLEEHIVTTHYDKKDFKSTICLKQYAQEKDFQDHVKSHGVDKPIKCEQNIREHADTILITVENAVVNESSNNSSTSYLTSMELPENESELPETLLSISRNLEAIEVQLNCDGEAVKDITKTNEIRNCDNESYSSPFLAEMPDIIDVTSDMEDNSSENRLPKCYVQLVPLPENITSTEVVKANELNQIDAINTSPKLLDDTNDSNNKPFNLDTYTSTFTHASHLKLCKKSLKCNLCHKHYKSRSSLEYHMISHIGQKPFKCTECNYACRKNSALNRHYWSIHNISKTKTVKYCCSTCGKNFLYEYDFKRHALTHLKPFKCSTCGMSFSAERNLKRHMIMHTTAKNPEEQYECHTCNKRFIAKASLEYHLKSHMNSKQCMQEKDLQDYLKSHGVDKLAKCEENISEQSATVFVKTEGAGVDESSSNSVTIYLNNTHLPENESDTCFPNMKTMKVQLNCNGEIENNFTKTDEIRSCNKESNSSQFLAKMSNIIGVTSQMEGNSSENWLPKCYVQLVRLPENITSTEVVKVSELNHLDAINTSHRLSDDTSVHDGETNLKCHLCHKHYKAKASLAHTGKKPFKCTECNDACKKNLALINDYWRKYNISKAKTSNYCCSICGKNFPYGYYLKRHISTHLKLFKCSVCGMSISSERSLERHMITHTSEKPYECHICHKCYTTKETLNYHLKFHTGETPFKCSQCKYACKTRRSLNRHFKIHNRNRSKAESKSFKSHSVDNPAKCEENILEKPVTVFIKSEEADVDESSNNSSTIYFNTLQLPENESEISKTFLPISRNMEAMKVQLNYEVEVKKDFTKIDKMYSCDNESNNLQSPVKIPDNIDVTSHLECNNSEYGLPKCYVQLVRLPENITSTEVVKVSELNHLDSINTLHKTMLTNKLSNKHMIIDGNDKPFKCYICAASFSCTKNIKRHTKCVHDCEKNYKKCHLCHKLYTSKSSLDYHMKTHSGQKPFTCIDCNYACSNKWALNKHCWSKHNIAKAKAAIYSCSICGKNFPYEFYLKTHMLTHLKPFKCSTCGMSFSYEQNLQRHMITHTGENPYECHLCHKHFTTKASLKFHLTSHTAQKPFKCTECSYACRKNSDLNKHYSNKHNIAKANTGSNYCCSICGKNFPYEFYLKRHMLTHLKPFKCSTCGMSFSIKTNLRRHMITHTGEKPYECHLCHKRFTVKASLEYHLKCHTGQKPFKCTECSYACRNNSFLNKHYWTKHNISKAKATNCSCSICGKNFPSEFYLKRHMLTHLKPSLKLFKCSICELSISSKGSLKRHMITHTGEKPFECNLCHKCFTTKASLEYHLKSHMGVKPFKCTQCEYACKTQKELKRHLKIHDKNQSKAKSKPSEKSNLEDRILDNQKSFKCSVCLEQYTQEKDLKDHLKSHYVDKLMEREENVAEYATVFIKSGEEYCTEPLELEEDIKVEYAYLNDEFENSDNTEDVKYFNLEAASSIIKDPLP